MRIDALVAVLAAALWATPGLAQTDLSPLDKPVLPPAVAPEEPAATGAIGQPSMDDARPETAVSTDQWLGTPVISADGVRVGKVSDVQVDADGRPVYAFAEIGGFLGFGTDTVRLPVTESDFAGGELRVGLVESDIKALAERGEDSPIGITPR